MDKKLTVEAYEWFSEIKNHCKPLEEELKELELNKSLTPTEKSKAIESVRTRLLKSVDVIRTMFENTSELVFIPKLNIA